MADLLALKMLPQYCERSGAGLYDEPINTASNISFFIAAWIGWRMSKRYGTPSVGLQVLAGLTLAVGIGSSLWHMFATPWAHAFDAAPILLFQFCFLWLYCRRSVGLPWQATLSLLLLLAVVAMWGSQHQEWLNGVLLYSPALALFLIAGIDHYFRSEQEPFLLLAAMGVFCLSLFFRTIDMAMCPIWSGGTHFLWHLLNSVVLILSMRALSSGGGINREVTQG